MRTRPRTRFVKKLKARRCSRCQRKLDTRSKRCKHCNAQLGLFTKQQQG